MVQGQRGEHPVAVHHRLDPPNDGIGDAELREAVLDLADPQLLEEGVSVGFAAEEGPQVVNGIPGAAALEDLGSVALADPGDMTPSDSKTENMSSP